jgi:hypothetical protein
MGPKTRHLILPTKSIHDDWATECAVFARSIAMLISMRARSRITLAKTPVTVRRSGRLGNSRTRRGASGLFACCNEGSTAVKRGALRYRSSSGQRVSPGTVGRFPSSRSTAYTSGRPRLRDGPRAGPVSGGSPAAWVSPPRRQQRCIRPGAGVHVVQPPGAPHGPLPLARSKARPPTRRDTHLRTLMSWDRTSYLARPSILSRAPRVPVPPGTHGEPRTLTVRISLTVHRNTSLLTDRYRPHLCKAVLQPAGHAWSTAKLNQGHPVCWLLRAVNTSKWFVCRSVSFM